MRKSIQVALAVGAMIALMGMSTSQGGPPTKAKKKSKPRPPVVAIAPQVNALPNALRGIQANAPQGIQGVLPDGSVIVFENQKEGKLKKTIEPAPKEFSVQPYAKDNAHSPAELRLREQVARALEQAKPVPPERVDHFRWVDQSPLEFRGWTAMIRSVSPAPTGWMAEVRFYPNVVSREGGKSATALNPFIEFYSLDNGTLHYVRGTNGGHTEPSYVLD